MTSSEIAEKSFEETITASEEFTAGLRAQIEWHQAEVDAISAAIDRKVQAAAAAATEIATAAARGSMELLAAGVEAYCSSHVP